jgi:hypothetical protein
MRKAEQYISKPDGGRIINAECHIVASSRDSFISKTDEQLLSVLWPDWDTKICEFISLQIGPGNDPARRIYELKARDVIKMVLLWVLSESKKHGDSIRSE